MGESASVMQSAPAKMTRAERRRLERQNKEPVRSTCPMCHAYTSVIEIKGAGTKKPQLICKSCNRDMIPYYEALEEFRQKMREVQEEKLKESKTQEETLTVAASTDEPIVVEAPPLEEPAHIYEAAADDGLGGPPNVDAL